MMKRLNQADNKVTFENVTFYLDLRSNPGIRGRLCLGIQTLKGTVLEFLSKDVKYIVTDKDESLWPKNSDKQPNQEQPSTASNSKATPTSIVSVEILSRGKLIVDKAATEGSTTTDVLVTATKMGIKIVKAQKMVDYLEHHVNARLEAMEMRSRSSASALTTTGQQTMNGDETSPSLKMKSVRAIQFTNPFIKVESTDSSSRPMYKTFPRWPDFMFDYKSTGCPFRPTMNTTSSKAPQPPAVPEQKAQPQVKASNAKNFNVVMSANIPKPGFRKVQLDSKCTGVKITGTYAKERRRYCEICGLEYDRLHEHLASDRHQLFVQDSDNYIALFGVIKSLPSLADLEYEEEDDIYDSICNESPAKLPKVTNADPDHSSIHGLKFSEVNELSEQF